MSITYLDFLNCIINDGIEAATADYADDAQKREGAIAGFGACRNKQPAELQALLVGAGKAAVDAYITEADDYWRTKCYYFEVEWVCNCVSAMLCNEGQPTIIVPTARGFMKAAEIVGVSA